MDFSFYFKLFIRRFHYFLMTVVICSVSGFYIARTLPTIFQAEARLIVESEQIPDTLASSTVRTNPNEQLQIIQQRIFTRDVLIDLANRLEVYKQAREEGAAPLTSEEIVEDMRERITINVSAPPRRGEVVATIVRLSFVAENGTTAARVTNELVNLILAEDVGMRTGIARQTLQFFQQEVTRLDQELSEKSAAILAFQETNLDALPDSLEFRRSQRAASQERLLQVERNIAALNERLERLAQLEAATTANGVSQLAPQEASTPEQQRLQDLKSQLTQLLSVLSSDNPRVKLVEREITGLEAIVATQALGDAANLVGDDGEQLSMFDVQRVELEAQLEFLDAQRLQLTDEIRTLTRSIEQTPANIATLTTLERDLAAVQLQYDQAINALAVAETGDTIEALSKGQRISIIETAIAPQEPTSPNRPLIMAAGVGGGIFLGLALVVVLELLRPGIRRPADLIKGLGITPFATLPYLRTRQEIVRRRVWVWGGVIVILSALAGAIWAVDQFYMPLDAIVEQIQRRLL